MRWRFLTLELRSEEIYPQSAHTFANRDHKQAHTRGERERDGVPGAATAAWSGQVRARPTNLAGINGPDAAENAGADKR